MNEEFINTFIDTMNKKIEELTRNEIMLNTKLAISQRAIDSLNNDIANLKQENEKLAAGLNKKAAISKIKDDTF
jgi:response regulator of citrate/malate metabolism